MITPKTMTIDHAMQRHQGMNRKQFQLMLLRGELKGNKVGHLWHISVADLDKKFGG